MHNRIRQIEIYPRSLTPAEAEVRVVVFPERRTATTEVRGRLMGPACPFATTIEVAYHLRPVQGSPAWPEGSSGIAMRAIIPEASLWEPQSPFLYSGPIELWQDGQLCDRVRVRCGLRSLVLGSRGLRINGKLLPLRGRELAACSEEQALALRHAGVNLLILPVEPSPERDAPEGVTAANSPNLEAVWELADRLGFLILRRLQLDTGANFRNVSQTRHPSCLGWLFSENQSVPESGLEGQTGEPPPLLGLEVSSSLPPTLPPGVSFAVTRFHPGPLAYPCLLRAPGETARPDQVGELVLGWIE